MQTAIKKIYTLLKSDNTLKGYLSGTATDSKIYPALRDDYENFPCLIYSEVASSFRTVPKNVQDLTFQLQIFSKEDKQNIENIYTSINNLLNYYYDKGEIVYSKMTLAVDSNLTDRQLYAKTLRYQVWLKN